MKRPLPPKSIVKLIKLWPHARKRGYEIGQSWRIGYYTPKDGLDVVWLVDANGDYSETADHDWLEKYFEVSFMSNERSFFGLKRTPLGPLP
jgi:hypothetical protein